MSEPTGNPLVDEPATPEACAADYADRDQSGEADTQFGLVYGAAQDGQHGTSGGRS
ncbi:hypothetical protein AB0I94_02310 [Streptomyces sp. NPDC050147]|uniref:hypothetical protein n=1 Tax=Streptomyces sp. NPDC050147 TaxID=3155513 RepID=UPI0034252451